MKKAILSKVLQSRLFNGCELKTTIDFLNKNGQIINCEKKDYLPTVIDDEKYIGTVISGEFEIHALNGNQQLMKTLKSGNLFGLAGLFSTNKNLSRILCKKTGAIFILKKNPIQKLMESNQTFSSNYLFALSDRIAYLNQKINYLSCENDVQKLGLWILSHGQRTFTIDVSITDLSMLLGMGRASIYRVFNTLIDEGLIQKTDNTIQIINESKLNAKINSKAR